MSKNVLKKNARPCYVLIAIIWQFHFYEQYLTYMMQCAMSNDCDFGRLVKKKKTAAKLSK